MPDKANEDEDKDGMSNQQILDHLETFTGGEDPMLDYVLPTEPLGESWVLGYKGQILKFTTKEGIMGFIIGVNTAFGWIMDSRDRMYSLRR